LLRSAGEYNTRAIACFKKCGFVIEGNEREGALIENRWETDVIMSILDYEYFNQKKPQQISSPSGEY